jgi:hypothetical protein
MNLGNDKLAFGRAYRQIRVEHLNPRPDGHIGRGLTFQVSMSPYSSSIG